MSSTLPSNSSCREVSVPGVVLPCGPTWVCPDMMPSMNRAAPAAAPMTILGNLNMAFFLAGDGKHVTQSIAFGAIRRFLHFNSIMLSQQFMQICPGFTISYLRPDPPENAGRRAHYRGAVPLFTEERFHERV